LFYDLHQPRKFQKSYNDHNVADSVVT